MSQLTIDVSTADHIQGNPKAKVTLVEYGDYECSHCGAAYPIVKEIQQIMGDRLRFVFRNFPLSNMHPFAEIAAESAEAAASQGKFWEMHDVIYENQETLNDRQIFVFAKMIGLDMATFKKDIESRKFKDRVKKDFMSGVKSGVNGTPAFFINGERFDGNFNDESFVIALKSAGK